MLRRTSRRRAHARLYPFAQPACSRPRRRFPAVVDRTTPAPQKEAQRLRALADYHFIDSAPEVAFDDLTSLAAQICGCPMALVTCIDDRRQWFKSRVGVDLEETPREHAFCAHAISEPERLMIVPDATADPRFVGNPFVVGAPSIRFYAGAPLLVHTGDAIGTLCVLDRQPRKLADHQLSALRILGRQVTYLLELRRVSHALAAALDRSSAA